MMTAVFNSTTLPPKRRLNPMPDLADYLTTEDAAAKLGFHIAHIRRMLRDGDLDGLKVGKTWLVSKKSVAKYLKDTEGLGKFDPRRGNN